MTTNLRSRVADALYWTTELMQKGKGSSRVRRATTQLDDIQKFLGGRIPDELPKFAFCIDRVVDDPGGAEVGAGKTQFGLFVLGSTCFIESHFLKLGFAITEGFAFGDSRAEQVTVSVKGKPYSGFRVIGSGEGLYVLDTGLVGTDGSKARIRDLIVFFINGETQIGPSEETLKVPGSAIVRLVSVANDFRDVRNPPLDDERVLKLDDQEIVLYEGQHAVRVCRHIQVAFGSPWPDSPAPTSPASVWITDRRVAVVWRDWTTDSAAKTLSERHRRAGFSPNANEPIVAASQLTYAWISNVFFGKAEESLEFQATDVDMPVRIRILGFGEGERRLPEVAAAIANFRLTSDGTVDPTDRETLTLIGRNQTAPIELSWGIQFPIPSSFLIGRDGASTQN